MAPHVKSLSRPISTIQVEEAKKDDPVDMRDYFDLVNNQLKEVFETQQLIRQDIQDLPRLLMGVDVLQRYQLKGEQEKALKKPSDNIQASNTGSNASFADMVDDQQEQQVHASRESTANQETETDPATEHSNDQKISIPSSNSRTDLVSSTADSYKKKPGRVVQGQKSGVLLALASGTEFGAGAGRDTSSWRARLEIFVAGNLDIVTGVVVVLNLMVMVVEMEYLANVADAALGFTDDLTWSSSTGNILDYIEYAFALVYFLDLLLRLLVQRSAFIYNQFFKKIQWFNILDGCIVIVNVVDIILAVVASTSMGASATLSRMVKVARLSRVFRIVRTFKLCLPLRALVSTCIASGGALAWSMILLFLCKAMCALILSQTVHSFIMFSLDDLEVRIFAQEYYGSFFRAMYTVFEITHSGSWPARTRPLVDKVSEWYALLFMAYITLVVFALVRIVTALFLKETLEAASGDAALQMEERKKQGAKYRNQLCEVFHNLDESGNGAITKEEFVAAMANPVLRKYLSVLGIDVYEVRSLFDVIDGEKGDGQIEAQEFIDGLLRLKGQARAIDMITLLHEGRKTTKHIESLRKSVKGLEAMMGGSGKPDDCARSASME